MSRPISDIYKEYRVPPWLAEHMVRVAAVAVAVFDALKASDPSLSGREDLIAACLLHDIGNIVKFNFTTLPPPDGRTDYWKDVQADMVGKYGSSEHPANEAIFREIGVLDRIAPVLRHTSDYDALTLEKEGTVLQRIVAYADQRVAPSGIVSLEQRLRDMRARYGHEDNEQYRALDEAIIRNEAWLFRQLALRPEDITESSTASLQAELSAFEI